MRDASSAGHRPAPIATTTATTAAETASRVPMTTWSPDGSLSPAAKEPAEHGCHELAGAETDDRTRHGEERRLGQELAPDGPQDRLLPRPAARACPTPTATSSGATA